MAGPEKHKSKVNRWKYKRLVSLNFFLENISSFLFLRQSRGRRYRAGKRQGRGEMGPVGELVQEIAPLYMPPAGPRSCQTWPGAVIWSHLLVPRTAANWGQGSQSSSICSATDVLKTEGLWTNCQVRSSPGKKMIWILRSLVAPFGNGCSLSVPQHHGVPWLYQGRGHICWSRRGQVKYTGSSQLGFAGWNSTSDTCWVGHLGQILCASVSSSIKWRNNNNTLSCWKD